MFSGHSSFVNSVCSARRGPPLVVSSGDDCSIIVWDQRRRRPVTTLTNPFQVSLANDIPMMKKQELVNGWGLQLFG